MQITIYLFESCKLNLSAMNKNTYETDFSNWHWFCFQRQNQEHPNTTFHAH